MMWGLNKVHRYLLAGACGVLAICISEAKAQDLQSVQSQIDDLKATIEELQKQVADAKAQAAAAKSAAADSGKSDLDLKVKWKGAPEFSSANGKFKLKVRGRVEAEYEHADQDKRITSFPDLSATEIRRARLGMEGVVFYDVKYIVEVDFANDDTRVRDAYLQYQGVKLADTPIYFRVGNFKTPNSFENITSELYIDTLERAAFINAWELDRHIGFMTAYWTDHFGLAAGIFGEGGSQSTGSIANTPLFPGFIGDENWAFAARATVAPINRETNGVPQVLHFGASVRTRETGNDQAFFQYRARGADLHMTNFAVNTGRIVDEDTFWGLEAAALWGPFSLQGEYGHTDVELPSGAFIRSNPPAPGRLTTTPNPFSGVPNPEYAGWYVDGSWFFGGHKTYNQEGKWDRPKIDNPLRWGERGGWGALQIVGKYNVLDLSDNAFNDAGGCRNTQLYPGLSASSTVTLIAPSIGLCGEMKTWTVGANWYLNEYVRLMFDYSESDLGDYPVTTIPATATNTTVPPGTSIFGFDGAVIRGFGMRAQVDW